MDPSRQLEYYEAKYKLDPQSRVFAPLADIYRRQERFDEALHILEAGFDHHPDYVTARVIQGRCFFDRESFDEAREIFEGILEADPDNLVVLRLLTEDAARRRDWDEALRLSGRIVRLDPHDGEAETRLKRWRAERTPDRPDADALSGRLTIDSDAAALTESAQGEDDGIKDASLVIDSPAVAAADDEPPRPAADAGAEETEMGEQRQAMATRTLADVYLAQGYRDKALQVLKQILGHDPTREDVRERIATLEAADEVDALAPEVAEETDGDLGPAVAPIAADDDEDLAYFESWLTKLQQKKEKPE